MLGPRGLASGAHVAVRRVPPFGRTCARHGGARSGASGGLQSRNRRGTSSRFGRSARDALFGERRESGSSLRESRKGSAPANAPRGETSPRERTSDHDPRLVPVRRSVAEVVGPLSGSEKRAIGIVRVESPGGAPDARGREPSLGEVGARERADTTLTKGRAVPRRQSDPHHVSARHSREAAWLAYVLRRVRGVHAALGDGRCLGSAKRAHLSRGSAWKRPRRPPEQTSIGDRSSRAPGEATEMPRAVSHRARGRTNNPHAISIGSPSGLRVVKRAFPRSCSHRRAPSPSVNALPSSDGRESRV